MSQYVADALSLVLSCAGVLVLVSGLLRVTPSGVALPLTMEFWTGAGLLRLVGDPSWQRIAAAAAVVLVRQMVLLRRAHHPGLN